jgi:Cobalamin biosynthesis protein CbiG
MNLGDKPLNWIIFSFSNRGKALAKDIEVIISSDEQAQVLIYDKSVHENIEALLQLGFCKGNAILFIGAVGIAVRAIAPYINDKLTDPAVIVIDDFGEFVIPILSGHIGGANRIASALSNALKEKKYHSKPVITTATDKRGVTGIEEIFKRYGVPYQPHRTLMKRLNMHLANGGEVEICLDPYLADVDRILLKDNTQTERHEEVDTHVIRLLITLREPTRWFEEVLPYANNIETLVLESQSLLLGTGSKKELSFESYAYSLEVALKEEGFLIGCIQKIASISLKKEELCMCTLAKQLDVEFVVHEVDKLLPYESLFKSSEFVKGQVGIGSVAGTCAYYHTQDEKALKVYKRNGSTFSIGRLIR